MKKYLALLLALVLAFGVVLSACGGDKAPETTAPKADAGNDATDAPATDAPTDAPVELRELKLWGANPLYGIEEGRWESWMTDDHVIWNEVKKQLADIGIELVIEEIANESFGQTVTNRVNAALDLPDIISFEASGINQAQIVDYGQKGMFMEVLEAIETYDEDGSIMAWFEQYESYPSVLDENGDLWFIPYMNGNPHDFGGNGPWIAGTYCPSIRADWLEKIGVEWKPYFTPDEIVDILIQFREQDVNGNGVADEVMTGGLNYEAYFAPGLGIGANSTIYALSDGTFGAQIDHPNFPKLVEIYQKLWNAGVISPDQFNEGWAPTAANRTSMLFSYEAQTWEEQAVVGFEDTANYAPFIMDDDGGENGFFTAWSDAPYGMLSGWAINAEADAETVVDFLDWLCTKETVLLSKFGVEGIHWEYNEEGIAVEIMPADQRDVNNTSLGAKFFFNMVPNMTWAPYTDVSGEAWREGELKRLTDLGYPEKGQFMYEVDYRINEEHITYASSSGFYAMATAEENAAIAEVQGQVDTYYAELMYGLMTGEKSIEDLPTYRAELTELGFDIILEAKRAQNERYWAALEG